MGARVRGAVALALLVGAPGAHPAEPEIRRAFRLEGERGEVAFRPDLVTMFSSGPVQSVKIARAGAERTTEHLARSDAHRPLLCDPLDQIDLSARVPGVRAALPASARLKSLTERAGVELAVYSLPGEGRYYETWLALVARVGGGEERRLLKMKRISEGSGTFCGAHPMGQNHLLVLVEGETRGRGVLVAYGLAIEP